ncbi:MAG: TrkA family potassium uptake protein [Dehalococcoidales bacterium]|nr:TrkA family potassium uptake protein [Dehalococcoidales bacterium]
MHIIVVGCGRVGARLSSLLSSAGNSVVVIDKDAQAFERLERTFHGKTLEGIAFDRKLLIEAGIEHADALAAVTGGDNSNIVVASAALDDFRVPRVMARISDPIRADMFSKLGIITISSTIWTSTRMYEFIISPELHNVFSVGSTGVQLYEFEVPNLLVDRSVRDLNVASEIRVVAITRESKAFIPVLGTTFQSRDRVLAAVDMRALEKLKAMLGMIS